MERIFRSFSSHEEAEASARADDNALTYQERFDAFMQLMAPYYAVPPGFQRIYRVDAIGQRSVRDDWGVRIQPLPESSSDR